MEHAKCLEALFIKTSYKDSGKSKFSQIQIQPSDHSKVPQQKIIYSNFYFEFYRERRGYGFKDRLRFVWLILVLRSCYMVLRKSSCHYFITILCLKMRSEVTPIFSIRSKSANSQWTFRQFSQIYIQNRVAISKYML